MKRFTRRFLFSALAAVPFIGKALGNRQSVPLRRRNLPTEDFVYSWLALEVSKPAYRALVFRLGVGDAEEWAAAAKPFYKLGGIYHRHERYFTFPSGAKVFIATEYDTPDRWMGFEFQSMFIERTAIKYQEDRRRISVILSSWRTHRQDYLPLRLLLGDQPFARWCPALLGNTYLKAKRMGWRENRYWEVTSGDHTSSWEAPWEFA